ncbi:MAG: helix-turn-helix domain-containing protein [Candidatus Bathycorpusculaceae bacterium]
MKSLWGNVKVVYDKCGRYVRGMPRKKYTRSHPYPEHISRFNPLPREKAAIVILRKKGYRIHELAKFLGRSTSFIHRVLSRNYLLGLRRDDKRKMPCKTKKYWRFKRWAKLVALWEKWEMWILGEGDKPP